MEQGWYTREVFRRLSDYDVVMDYIQLWGRENSHGVNLGDWMATPKIRKAKEAGIGAKDDVFNFNRLI